MASLHNIHISKDRRLQDSAPIRINGTTYSRKVSYWIEVDPLRLWLANKLQKLSLSRDAYAKLKAKITELYPELINHSNLRKIVHRAKISVVEKEITPLDIKRKLVSGVYASADEFIRHHELHGVEKTNEPVMVLKKPVRSTWDVNTFVVV